MKIVALSTIIFIIVVFFNGISHGCEYNRLEVAANIRKNLSINIKDHSLLSYCENAKFYLYTRKNHEDPEELILGNIISFRESNFKPQNQIRILIHGYFGHSKTFFNKVIKNAYLKKGDFNVIVFDWSALATYLDYTKVIDFLSDQAQIIVNFTKFMNKHLNVPYDNIYLIGFSLGAHLASYAGRLLSPDKYNTIFLLDPAGPIFQQLYLTNHSVIAQSGDAKYVEAIHTEMGYFGFSGRNGDADIYPDFGVSQKCCVFSFLRLDFQCNHCASVKYFAASINEPNKWLAKQCDNFESIKNKTCECTNNELTNCDQKFQIGGEPSTHKKGVFYTRVKLPLSSEYNY